MLGSTPDFDARKITDLLSIFQSREGGSPTPMIRPRVRLRVEPTHRNARVLSCACEPPRAGVTCLGLPREADMRLVATRRACARFTPREVQREGYPSLPVMPTD